MLLVSVALALVAPLAVPVSAASPEERRLEQTQAQISAVRDQIEAAKGRRDSDAAALADAEAQLAVVLEAVQAAELSVQRQQEAVVAARDELERLEEESRRQERVMGNRAVELYREGSTSLPFASILSASSTAEAVERSGFVEILSRADRAAYESVEISQVAVDGQRERLEAEEATLERVLEGQREIYAQVDELRDERSLVLAGSQEALSGLEAQERHLESESRELAAMIRRAEQQAAAEAAAARAAQERSAQDAAAQASGGGGDGGAAGGAGESAPARSAGGGWVWPASGPVTSEYGQRWGRMHEGIDIGAGTGAPVVAARGGTVSHAGRMGGYGNLVLVSHGDGIVTAYAHMSALSVSAGASVSAGQRLGSVGCTGSCTGPHLHFEVRVNGAPRNPRNYL
ncbi:MAG: murein hydrolase activator EnvC family protein [Egibacteraceae bacterium]